MRKIISALLFFILLPLFICLAQQKSSSEGIEKLIVFTEFKEKKMLIKALDFSINQGDLTKDIMSLNGKDYLIYVNGQNLLLVPNYGFSGEYQVYDMLSGEKKYFRISKAMNKDQFLTGYSFYNDSVMICAGESDLFLVKINNPADYDIIPFTKMNLANISVSCSGIAAVNYNSEDLELNKKIPSEYGELILIDLINKKILKKISNASFIGNWSADGNQLIYNDDGLIKILDINTDNNIVLTEVYDRFKTYDSFYFVDINKIIFCGIDKNENDQTNPQIYLYDLELRKLVRKITSSPVYKTIIGITGLSRLSLWESKP